MRARSSNRFCLCIVLTLSCVGCGGGDDDDTGDSGTGGAGPTASMPITSTCTLGVEGDEDSGVETATYESVGCPTSDPSNCAFARGTGVGNNAPVSVVCGHKGSGDDGITNVSFNLLMDAPFSPVTVSNETSNYTNLNLIVSTPKGSFTCLGSPGNLTYSAFSFEISSILSTYRADAKSVVMYDIVASGHGDCLADSTTSGTTPPKVSVDVSFP